MINDLIGKIACATFTVFIFFGIIGFIGGFTDRMQEQARIEKELNEKRFTGTDTLLNYYNSPLTNMSAEYITPTHIKVVLDDDDDTYFSYICSNAVDKFNAPKTFKVSIYYNTKLIKTDNCYNYSNGVWTRNFIEYDSFNGGNSTFLDEKKGAEAPFFI